MGTSAEPLEWEPRDLSELSELDDLTSLFQKIWGTVDTPLPLDLLRALSDAGGMVLGVFEGASLIGGAVGFRSADDPAHLHSHMVGVHPDRQSHGVGSVIKHHQRTWCLARGIHCMTWTFDPLRRRNALFNITRLGAVGHSYLVDHYGPLDDTLNIGVPTDRVLIRWDLDVDRPPAPTDAEPVLDVGEHGEPRRITAGGAGAVRLRLPSTVPAGHALEWRIALREAMAPRLDAGYRWTGMSDDGWCVLEPPHAAASTRPGTEAR